MYYSKHANMFSKVHSVLRTHKSRCLRLLTNMAKISQFTTEGVVAAPFTPFTSDGEIDFDKFGPYIDHLVEYECKNLFVLGTTGEGLNMTVEERKLVTEEWMKAKSRLLKVVIQIGAGNMKDSMELAQHAQALGADAISCVAPSYYGPETEEQLVDYMQNVASCAPTTPFYLYDIDFMTNIKLDVERFFALADQRIPTLRGMKYSSPYLAGLARCVNHRGGKWHVMIGTDDQYLMGLVVGCETSVLTSYLVPTHQRMYKAFKKGDMDEARLQQDRCLKVSKLRSKHGIAVGGFAVSRSVMPMLGLDIGPPRLPLSQLNSVAANTLKKDLEEIGFFDWAKAT